METFREFVHTYRWLGFALLFTGAVSSAIISCGGGGGGGSSNGELCQQCGDTDGPCQATAFIVPGAKEPAPCPTPPSTDPACIERDLICRRKADSAQQRCFPANESGSDVDFSFKCDDSRPGGTAKPQPVTPTPATPAATPTKTADATAICGNDIIQGLEFCDGISLGGLSCADFCNGDDGGTLLCGTDCKFNTSLCTGLNCS